MNDAPDHNAARWLILRFLPSTDGGRGMREGWYVVRVCPCHWGERVTVPYTSEARAAQARRVMLTLREP